MLFILFNVHDGMSFLSLRYKVALSVSRTAPHTHTYTHTHTHTQVSTLPLVFVNIKSQNEYLNMNYACLLVN